ncbi:MAG: ribonuclease HI [Candidatus Shikimatogenerans bostrichidophilus]|nr:MAG: ribonuclease HI [Candidatus Shikimatogenerans bostrichidophilus]
MSNKLILKKNNLLYINIYTDGSSLGNPGIGGYSIIIISYYYYKEFIYGKFRYTTNNRMELKAIIKAIKIINNNNYYFNINFFTDSKYILDTINKKRLIKWYKNKFYNKKNYDLWKFFIINNIYKKKNINFFWIKGHYKNFYNIKCNFLAKKAANNKKIFIDYNYEKFKIEKNNYI